MDKEVVFDPFGEAVSEYFSRKFFRFAKLVVRSSISSTEIIRPSYLFRSFKKLPPLEKKALENCSGKILDIGACSGSHTIILQNKGYDVTALEVSSKCCEVMDKRGVKNIVCKDIFNYSGKTFDTLIMLMNGIGLAGTILRLEVLLNHFKTILSPGGKVLFDSSDIDYMYFEKDGSKWVDLANEYYGQVKYTLEYKGKKGDSFDWLFIDQNKMQEISAKCGFQFTVLAEGNHYDYLGELKLVR